MWSYISLKIHIISTVRNITKVPFPYSGGGGQCVDGTINKKNVILRLEYLITDTRYFMKKVLSATCVH